MTWAMKVVWKNAPNIYYNKKVAILQSLKFQVVHIAIVIMIVMWTVELKLICLATRNDQEFLMSSFLANSFLVNDKQQWITIQW